MEDQDMWRLAGQIPKEWYAADTMALEKLVKTLTERRGAVRDLIGAFRDSVRNPFPAWLDRSSFPKASILHSLHVSVR